MQIPSTITLAPPSIPVAPSLAPWPAPSVWPCHSPVAVEPELAVDADRIDTGTAASS